MTHAASLSDWFAFLSLGVAVHAGFSVFYFLFVEAEPADFDPRPAVRRALETDTGALLLNRAVWARDVVADTVRDCAALVILLTTSPKGAMA